MNPQTLKYLQNDEVGKVIATGLATLYMNKPQKPIKYLAEWLKTYSRNQKQMNNLLQAQKTKKQVHKSYEQEIDNRHKVQKELQARQKAVSKSHEDFKKTITDHEYAEDLLEQILAQFLQQNTSATGVYIGELNYPHKQVTDQDTEQSAHLNTAADKLINYIGSSVSHKQLMRGKSLKTTQGVTANSFSLLQQVAPVVNQDGQQVTQPATPKYTFVPNVVKNDAITYFKIPKLGSYLAVPIVCNEYLTQTNFDQALKSKQEYLKQCEQLQKTKKAELEQLHKDKEQIEKKIADLTEKNGDEAHLQQLNAELKQTQQAIAEKEKQNIQYKQPTLTANKRSYVVCADTLGKDKPFEQSEIDFICSITNHFKQSWENKEKQLLNKDIDTHIAGLHDLKSEPQVLKQQLTHSIQPTEEQQKQIAAITEQNKKTHKQLQLELSKLKTVLKQNPIYLESFLHLKKMRVLKYKELIQNLLFLLGYKKSEVNIPKRASLDWRRAKVKYITEQTFNKVLSYNPIGAKKQQFTPYSKTPHLIEIFDKFDEEEVFKYNAALGAIIIYVKKALQLREIDVQVRKAKFDEDVKNREKIIQDNQKIQARFAEELQKHKNSLPPEQLQNFKEQAWSLQFFQKSPLHYVPEQIHQDIDNDM